MENLSRVKKNTELRQEVENSRESEVTSTVLSAYADRLNRISPELSTIELSSKLTDYNPLHSKGDPDRVIESRPSSEDPSFHHDLLGEFIDEVKSYNIKNGYSSSENTDLNIINKISQPIFEDKSSIEPSEDKMTQDIKRVISNDFEMDSNNDFNQSREGNMFEETAKINLKLENVDKELLEMSQSVNSSTRTLNFIVFILIVVLLVMLGLAFYWIFATQGF